MRIAVLLLVLAAACRAGAFDEPKSGPDLPPTDIRKELLSEFHYTAQPKDPEQPSPILAGSPSSAETPTSAPQVPDVVKMEPYTVRESLKMDALHADFAMQKASARSDAITKKLGVGVHVAPVGPVGFYAVTVFYIPILVGFGFSF